MVSFTTDDYLARAFLINKSDYLKMPFVDLILIQYRLLFKLFGRVQRFSFVLHWKRAWFHL